MSGFVGDDLLGRLPFLQAAPYPLLFQLRLVQSHQPCDIAEVLVRGILFLDQPLQNAQVSFELWIVGNRE